MVQKYIYLELFLNDLNKKINLSEFEEYHKKPHQTIKRHIQKLIEENILIETKISKFIFYQLNLKNPLTLENISICEKEVMFQFIKNPLFLEIYGILKEFKKEKPALIFGSSTKNKIFNDIDLYIYSNKNVYKEKFKEFEKVYGIKIHLIVSKRISKTFKEEIMKNHIILNNHDFFIDFFYKNDKKY